MAKSGFFFLYISLLILISSGCRTAPQKSGRVLSPMSIVPPREQQEPGKTITQAGYKAEEFISFLNSEHPGNRIGYRFQEHSPVVYGSVLEKTDNLSETARTDTLEKEYADRDGVFVHKIDIADKNGWVPQVWTFYIVPVTDGFEMLWVVEAKDKGLNEYYTAQQCFRYGGAGNAGWRKTIAESPAFSEYDLWQQQKTAGKPITSLSFVRRNNNWAAIPATENHIVCRTPMGLKFDIDRTHGDLTKVSELKPAFNPAGKSVFEPDIDCGLVTRVSPADDWVCALYWQRTTHISDHHPADCLHTFVNIGPIPPGGRRAVLGRIYWMKASKDELFSRWQKQWLR